MRLLLATAFGLLVTVAPALAQTCTTAGSFRFCDNGLSGQRIGDTTFWNHGPAYYRAGAMTFYSHGPSAPRFGDPALFNDSAITNRAGNTTLFGKRRTCFPMGGAVLCD